jgi:hypothetical protein
MSDLVIRRATRGDIPAIAALLADDSIGAAREGAGRIGSSPAPDFAGSNVSGGAAAGPSAALSVSTVPRAAGRDAGRVGKDLREAGYHATGYHAVLNLSERRQVAPAVL